MCSRFSSPTPLPFPCPFPPPPSPPHRYVIDCGKAKEKTYDVSKKIACLKPVWVSRASARQRRGRAGRVQPGVCFHLYTRHHYDRMAEFQLPEILRTPLEELLLQIKASRMRGPGGRGRWAKGVWMRWVRMCGIFCDVIDVVPGTLPRGWITCVACYGHRRYASHV